MRILGGPIFDTHLELLKITLAFFRLDVPSLEILKTLPVNVFPVQSGSVEKEQKNDYLAAVKINISISILAPNTKTNTHLASVFSRDRFGLVRDRASVLGHVPLDQGTTTHNRYGLLSLLMSPAVGGTAVRAASKRSHLKRGEEKDWREALLAA